MTREQRDAIYVWIDNGGPLSAGLEPAVREVLLRQDDSAATVRAWAKRNARSLSRYGVIPRNLRRDYVWHVEEPT